MDIVALTREHARYAADLHVRSLTHGFFPKLGRTFLRAYYDAFASSPHAIALLAVDGDRPLGVVVGMVDVEAHWRWALRRRGVWLALGALVGLARHPRTFVPFVRTRLVRYVRAAVRLGSKPAQDRDVRAVPTQRPAVLMHVAVDDQARGRGAGALLVDALVAAAAERGAARVELVTAADASGAAGFYRRLGWDHLRDRRDGSGDVVSVFATATGAAGATAPQASADG